MRSTPMAITCRGALTLPVDLPSEGVTPAYLAEHGGVTLTFPRPVDSRPGDTLVVFFGETDDTGKTINVLADRADDPHV